MKHLGIISLSVMTFLAACDTESATDPLAGSPRGDLRHERHFDQGNMSFRCNVYSTNSGITLDMTLNVVNQESSIRERLNIDYAAASYNGAMESAGLFNNLMGAYCDKFKADCATMNSADVTCSDNRITFDAHIPNVDPNYSALYVANSIANINSVCDSLYEEFLDSPFVGGVADETKKALSCDVLVDGTTITQVVTYPDKSMISRTALVNGVYAVSEEYSGIDAATLAQVCEAYKKEEEIGNVVCAGNAITYNPLINPDFNSLVQFAKEYECPGFLNGSYTFEDFWFDED